MEKSKWLLVKILKVVSCEWARGKVGEADVMFAVDWLFCNRDSVIVKCNQLVPKGKRMKRRAFRELIRSIGVGGSPNVSG